MVEVKSDFFFLLQKTGFGHVILKLIYGVNKFYAASAV